MIRGQRGRRARLAQTLLLRSARAAARPLLGLLRFYGGQPIIGCCALYHRYFEQGHLQFITTSTYRRAALFPDPVNCPLFVEAVKAARCKFRFRLVGWVLMPEHFHLLFQPADAGFTSALVKEIKQRSAAAILQAPARPQPCSCLSITAPGVASAAHRARSGAFPGLATALRSFRCVHREKADRETRLHAPQPGETRIGGKPSRLALVELAVL